MRLPRVFGPRLLFLLISLLFVCLGFRQILGLPSRSLTTHPEPGFQPTTIVGFPEGFKREARIREWKDLFPKANILLVDYPDSWPQQAGLRPTGQKILNFLLEKNGLNPDTILHVMPPGVGGWHPLRTVRAWLDAPDKGAEKLVLLVDYTRLPYYQNGARFLLTREQRQRVRFDTSVPPDGQPDTWWKSRYGWKDIATGWLLGTFGLLGGEGETPDPFQPGNKDDKPAWVPNPGEVLLP